MRIFVRVPLRSAVIDKSVMKTTFLVVFLLIYLWSHSVSSVHCRLRA